MIEILQSYPIGYRNAVLCIYKDTIRKIWGLKVINKNLSKVRDFQTKVQQNIFKHKKSLFGYTYLRDKDAEHVYNHLLHDSLNRIDEFCLPVFELYDTKAYYTFDVVSVVVNNLDYLLPTIKYTVKDGVIIEEPIVTELFGLPVICNSGLTKNRYLSDILKVDMSKITPPVLPLYNSQGVCGYIQYLRKFLCGFFQLSDYYKDKLVYDFSAWKLQYTTIVTDFCQLTITLKAESFNQIKCVCFYLPQNYINYGGYSFADISNFVVKNWHILNPKEITRKQIIPLLLIIQGEEAEIKTLLNLAKCMADCTNCFYLRHFSSYNEVKNQEDKLIELCNNTCLHNQLMGMKGLTNTKYIVSYSKR